MSAPHDPSPMPPERLDQAPDPRGRVVVVLHPLRRGADRIAAVLPAVCAAAGLPAPVLVSTAAGRPGGLQAAWAVERGAARVLAVGGDGTVRAVAGALVGTGVPLAIAPVGTADLFARNLGLRSLCRAEGRPLAAALRRALTVPPRPADAGRAELLLTGPEGAAVRSAIFLMVAGMGRDAQTVAAASEPLKARLRWLAYPAAGVPLLTAGLHPLTVQVDDDAPCAVRAWSALAGGAPGLPLGLRVFPGAALDSGSLELMLCSPRRLGAPTGWGGVAVSGLTGRPERAGALTYRTARRAVIRSRTPLPVQADGDLLGRAHELRVACLPGALQVVGGPRDPRV